MAYSRFKSRGRRRSFRSRRRGFVGKRRGSLRSRRNRRITSYRVARGGIRM